MIKRLGFILSYIFVVQITLAQSFSESFENVDDLLSNGGWVTKNLSNPRGSGVWYQDIGNFTAHSGSALSTIIADFTAIPNNEIGTISCWLFTPEIHFGNSDTLSFWANSFKGGYYPDRLEVRISTNGASTNVGNADTSVGDFSKLLYTINPALEPHIFPQSWFFHSIQLLNNVSLGQTGRIAFRYYVTDGGPRGHNGSTVGIDDLKFSTKTIVSTSENAQNSFNIFPNPITQNSNLNIEFNNNSVYTIEVFNSNGTKILHQVNNNTLSSVSTENWGSGIYIIKITDSNSFQSFSKKIIIQ